MRLHILGKDSDDKGTQLEILTKDILVSLGYERIVCNEVNNSGEIDVKAVIITKIPIKNRETNVIAECKAHKEPLNMTDWLKFLGKLYVEKINHTDTVGCLIALSGVNGNVRGSYESLVKNDDIRLVEQSSIIEYLSKTHKLASQLDIVGILRGLDRTYLSIEFLYYQRKVYWFVKFNDGNYTVFDSDGSYLKSEVMNSISELAKNEFDGNFVDIREEEEIRKAKEKRLK